jgi:DNA repair protein RadA/Sms
VAQTASRLKEAAKLGFVRAFVPDTAKTEAGDAGMALRAVGPLMEIVAEIAPKGIQRKPARAADNE